MDEWIRSLVAEAVKPWRTVIDAIGQRVTGVYQAFTNAHSRVRTAFGSWVGRSKAWVAAQGRNALATATFLHWLFRYYLPSLALDAVARAVVYADALFGQAVRLAAREVLAVRVWTSGLIGQVIEYADWLHDRTAGRIDGLVATLIRVRDLVFMLLTDPRKFARWAAGAIIVEVLAYLFDHAADVAELAWRNRVFVERGALKMADEIIDRLV